MVDKVRALKPIGPIHPNGLEQLVVGLRLARDLAKPLYGDVGGDVERKPLLWGTALGRFGAQGDLDLVAGAVVRSAV